MYIRAVGCKWSRHCSRYGSENETGTRLGQQTNRPTGPIKLPTAFSGFCTHTDTHTHTVWLLLFTRFTLLFIPFHILYLTARLDSTTCFNFAQFFQHNNRFNRIFNCSSIGRTNAHTGRSETRDQRDPRDPLETLLGLCFISFFFFFFHITARACAFWGALFP